VRACPRCGEANPDRLTACAFCGASLESEARPQEERKVLTVLFCDLKDSTVLGERLDPEPLGEVLDLYFTAMTRVLKRHGGSIEKFIGDAIVAAFGLPTVHEDDALRAVRSAVEMRDALTRLNRHLEPAYGVTLVTRTGVHTGEVVVRQAAGSHQVLTGDTMNTTARLEQSAGANEIYLGESTYRLVRGAVQVDTVEPLTLKGKEGTFAAYRLRAVVGDEQAARHHLAPLVGRERELESLTGMFERVVDERRCHLATVLGEAGVGKSRLVRALIDAVGHDATVLRGRCLPYGESITFWPFLAIVREACGIDELDSEAPARVEAITGDPEVARRVASALGWSDEDLPLAELFWGIRELLDAISTSGPVIVVIDDVHWAAPTLLELLEHLVERVTDRPILLLCTARPIMLSEHPGWGEGPDALRLVLGRLPDEVSQRLIANMTGGLEMPAAVTAKVVEAAEGNPLFVEQLVSMLIDRRLLVPAGGRWRVTQDLARLEVPPTIHALLAARLDVLEKGERQVVHPASVIGLEFSSEAVRSVVAEPAREAMPERLGSLAAKHLIREEHTPDEESDYRFDHLLIRDAAYAGILKRARADLHERVADWMAASVGRSEREEVIGYHLEQACGYRREIGIVDDETLALVSRASTLLASAGQRAFTRGDLPAAIDLLRRAHDVLPADDPARLFLIPDLVEALLESGALDEARTVLGAAPAATGDSASHCDHARCELVGLLVDLYAGDDEGWVTRAHAAVNRVMPVFEAAGNEAGLTAAWRVRNLAHVTALRYDQGYEAAEEIIRHAQAAGDVRQQRRGSIAYAVSALHGPTPVDEGIPRLEGLIRDVEGDRRTESVIGLCLAQLVAMDGRLDRARELVTEAAAVFNDLGQGVLAASVSTDSAPIEILAGEPATAADQLRRDEADLEKLGETYLRATVAGLLAGVLVELGDVAGAEAACDRARGLAGLDDVDAQVLWRSALARCHAARGSLEPATLLADEAVALTADASAPMLRAEALVNRAVVHAAAGRAAEAAAAFDEAVELHRAKGNRLGAAAAERARAESVGQPAS
jgi:class 3 adenylate cyclase/tetratricopeptide (TPR) repeat protein